MTNSCFSCSAGAGRGGGGKQSAPAERAPQGRAPPPSSGTRGVDGDGPDRDAILIERLRSEGRTLPGLTFPVLLKVGFLMAGTLGAGRRGRRGATPAAGSAVDGAWSPRAVAFRASPRAPETCSVTAGTRAEARRRVGPSSDSLHSRGNSLRQSVSHV